MSTAEENIALIRRYMTERTNPDGTPKDRMAVLDEIWADKIAFHGRELGEITTREDLKAMMSRFPDLMPDLKMEIESILGDEEYVVAIMRGTGTPKGDDASGTIKESDGPVTFRAIDMWRLKDGKLVECWVIEGLVDNRNPDRARVD